MTELDNMIELSDKYWLTQNDDKQKENINQLIKIITKATLNSDTLIYPARQYHMFYYDILNYYYRNVILSLKNGATLDDLKLSTKYWTWYFNSIIMPTASFNSNVIPITFDEFLNNRSLSKYTQKASKEIIYGNSNRNRNNSCKQ